MTRRETFFGTSASTTAALYALALAFTVAGCDEYPIHDLGYTNGNPPGSDDDPDEPLPPVAEFASEFAGVWIGEARDPLALQSRADVTPPVFRFPSGSARIRLELATDIEGAYPSGRISFGEGAPPPPPTDPDIGYPVDPDFDVTLSRAFDTSVRPPIEGFTYYAASHVAERDLGAAGVPFGPDGDYFFDEGRVVDGKLDLGYLPTEVFGSWCALQTEATCSPSQGIAWSDAGECFQGEGQTPVDCHKAALCMSGVCYCDEYGCSSSGERLSQLTVRLSNDGLVGLFSNAVFVNERGFQQPLGTVRFRRETP